MLRSEEDVPIIASATIAGIQTPMKVKSEHSENGVLKQLLMAEQQLPQHSSNCLQQSLQQLVMLSQHLPHPLQQIIMNYRLKQLWHFYISLDNIAFSIIPICCIFAQPNKSQEFHNRNSDRCISTLISLVKHTAGAQHSTDIFQS